MLYDYPMARQSDDPNAANPCGFMIQAYDMIEAIPCGRPLGHDEEASMIAGGHNLTPLPDDPPTKRWKQIMKWVVEE